MRDPAVIRRQPLHVLATHTHKDEASFVLCGCEPQVGSRGVECDSELLRLAPYLG